MKKPSVVSIISKKSNTGKTTLIQGLIPKLKERGYRVMTVKYSCYDFEADREGTDSYKHFGAGADRSILVGPAKFVTFEKSDEHIDIERLIDTYRDVDIIITEGFRNIDYPTIEVVRECMGTKICSSRKNLVAVATDSESMDFGVTSIDLNDYDLISDFIELNCVQKNLVSLVSL